MHHAWVICVEKYKYEKNIIEFEFYTPDISIPLKPDTKMGYISTEHVYLVIVCPFSFLILFYYKNDISVACHNILWWQIDFCQNIKSSEIV